ncbi:hypothetical protein L6250_00350 [Candidatus Parcubacteria bacterium]|nr:hypothetical protein [Patescibacteria group bacterium]MBU4466450.1 hypothetical protein [Patescibacteria group bacterium]MCG2688085.1 hypothetical protein [Candidatus Parcubacteria bacterium]
MIISQSKIDYALTLVRPAAEEILQAVGMTWGPQWVEGVVSVPGLNDFYFHLGRRCDEWDPEWGEKKDFREIAKCKLRLAKRLRMNTSTAVALFSWLLEEGDYLYPGGIYRDGIACAASGAKGRVDESLSEIVVSAIIMVAQLEADARKEHKQMLI